MSDEDDKINHERMLDDAIHAVEEGHSTHHLKQRLRVACPKCRERFCLEKKIVQRIGNEALTEIRGRWLAEFTEEHKKMLIVMKERYEAEYGQRVQELQEQYDGKLVHGIKEDMESKFENLMSEFLKRKIDAYRKGMERIGKQLSELSNELERMDEVPNPFEGDELFADGNPV